MNRDEFRLRVSSSILPESVTGTSSSSSPPPGPAAQSNCLTATFPSSCGPVQDHVFKFSQRRVLLQCDNICSCFYIIWNIYLLFAPNLLYQQMVMAKPWFQHLTYINYSPAVEFVPHSGTGGGVKLVISLSPVLDFKYSPSSSFTDDLICSSESFVLFLF